MTDGLRRIHGELLDAVMNSPSSQYETQPIDFDI